MTAAMLLDRNKSQLRGPWGRGGPHPYSSRPCCTRVQELKERWELAREKNGKRLKPRPRLVPTHNRSSGDSTAQDKPSCCCLYSQERIDAICLPSSKTKSSQADCHPTPPRHTKGESKVGKEQPPGHAAEQESDGARWAGFVSQLLSFPRALLGLPRSRLPKISHVKLGQGHAAPASPQPDPAPSNAAESPDRAPHEEVEPCPAGAQS